MSDGPDSTGVEAGEMSAATRIRGRRDEYVVARSIGAGATGGVYLAHDGAGRCVAAKRFAPSADLPAEELELLFRRECVALRLMESHPLVPNLIDTCDDDGWWLIEDFIDGPVLSELPRADQRLVPLHSAVLWATGLADVLEEFHARGLVYQDIKPENVLINERSWPVLVDLGGVRVLGDVDSLFGTDGFIAPEVTADTGRAPDHRTDVYALGLLLYALITGRRFTQQQIEAGEVVVSTDDLALREQVEGRIPPVVRGKLHRVLRRCLAANPDERYPVLSQFSRELMQAVDAVAGMAEPVLELKAALRQAWETQAARTQKPVAAHGGGLRVEPARLDFGLVRANQRGLSQAISVVSSGDDTTLGGVQSDQPWLTVTPTYFRPGQPVQISVAVDPLRVPTRERECTAHVTIRVSQATSTVPCTVEVTLGEASRDEDAARRSRQRGESLDERLARVTDLSRDSGIEPDRTWELITNPGPTFRVIHNSRHFFWAPVIVITTAILSGLAFWFATVPIRGVVPVRLALMTPAVALPQPLLVLVWAAIHSVICGRVTEMTMRQAINIIGYASLPQTVLMPIVCIGLRRLATPSPAVGIWAVVIAASGMILHVALVHKATEAVAPDDEQVLRQTVAAGCALYAPIVLGVLFLALRYAVG